MVLEKLSLNVQLADGLLAATVACLLPHWQSELPKLGPEPCFINEVF